MIGWETITILEIELNKLFTSIIRPLDQIFGKNKVLLVSGQIKLKA